MSPSSSRRPPHRFDKLIVSATVTATVCVPHQPAKLALQAAVAFVDAVGRFEDEGLRRVRRREVSNVAPPKPAIDPKQTFRRNSHATCEFRYRLKSSLNK
jgi:hypothetical protein